MTSMGKQFSTIADSDLVSGAVSGALAHGGGVRRLRVQAAVVHDVVGALQEQALLKLQHANFQQSADFSIGQHVRTEELSREKGRSYCRIFDYQRPTGQKAFTQARCFGRGR